MADKKVGRPTKDAKERREKVIKVRISEEDERVLEEIKEEIGLHRAEIMRMSLKVLRNMLKSG